jgi:hypothetical protein
MTMEHIILSVFDDSDASFRAILQGLENHKKLITTIWGSGTRGPVRLTQHNAHAVAEFLRRSTGTYKQLRLTGFLWHDDQAFSAIAAEFQNSPSHDEIAFEYCNFDAESSRRLCSIFSSSQSAVAKGIKLGQGVVFSPEVPVLETLAGSSPGLACICWTVEPELIDLEAIFRGLAKSTSSLPQLNLPSLPENRCSALMQALPTFTHLTTLEFESAQLTMDLNCSIIKAFQQNGSLRGTRVETSAETSDPFDDAQRAKMKAFLIRNQYLPVAFDSAIENKVADDCYGPCDFSFSAVPTLLRATMALSVLGPTRVLDVLLRCKNEIGPCASGRKRLPAMRARDSWQA